LSRLGHPPGAPRQQQKEQSDELFVHVAILAPSSFIYHP
jgi:hypothetical protein